jgi:very-short-patch-repair endonuclease
LWRHLRGKQVEGIRFRRQQPIGRYIADFVCFEKALVIELDGGHHTPQSDAERDRWFREQGFRTLRFWNNEVLRNISGVLEIIRLNCLGHPHPNLPPSRGKAYIP